MHNSSARVAYEPVPYCNLLPLHLYVSVRKFTRSIQTPIIFIRAVSRCFDCSGFACNKTIKHRGV